MAVRECNTSAHLGIHGRPHSSPEEAATSARVRSIGRDELLGSECYVMMRYTVPRSAAPGRMGSACRAPCAADESCIRLVAPLPRRRPTAVTVADKLVVGGVGKRHSRPLADRRHCERFLPLPCGYIGKATSFDTVFNAEMTVIWAKLLLRLFYHLLNTLSI